MGIDSGDAIDWRGPFPKRPRFIERDGLFWNCPPLGCVPGAGWAGCTIDEYEASAECNRLTLKLNRMQDRAEALRIGRAHEWFDDQKENP